MAGTYQVPFASGITDLGRHDPFDLEGGEGPIVDDQAQAADAQAILALQVVTYNAAGRVIPWPGTADFAYGSISYTAQPTAADTITVNGVVITYVAGTPAANQVQIGADLATTLASTAALINAAPDTYLVTANVSGGNTLNLTAVSEGTAGNTIALADSSTNTTVSGATLTDVTGAETVPGANPVGVAMFAVPATTPGGKLTIRVQGIFNHEVLVWPAGITTLAQRKMAFANTGLGIRQLL